METLFNTDTAIVTSSTISAALSAAIAYLFKYRWKPAIEKTYEDNVRFVNKIIFDDLQSADQYKQYMFDILEKYKDFKPQENNSVKLSKSDHASLTHCRDRIEELLDKIATTRPAGVLRNEQYRAVYTYLFTVRAGIRIQDDGSSVLYDRKALEDHRFSAKEVIESFASDVGKGFESKWRREFALLGGIDAIQKPQPEPGDDPILDVVGDHLLYYSPRDSKLWKKLQKIEDKVDALNDNMSAKPNPG